MLDKFITPIIKLILNPAVVMLHKRGISADQLTLVGFIIGMLASVAVISLSAVVWRTDCYCLQSYF